MFRTVAGIEVELRIVGYPASRRVSILSIDGCLLNPPVEVVLRQLEWNKIIYRKGEIH